MISKTDSSIDICKNNDICVPNRKQSGSTLSFSSCFLLIKVGIVHHFINRPVNTRALGLRI